MSDLLFVEIDSVMMHATSITTTSRMLPVLACGESVNVYSISISSGDEKQSIKTCVKKSILTNATMSVADMSSEFPGLRLLGRL